MNFEGVAGAVEQWHHDRNLIEGSTNKDQYIKLIEEIAEIGEGITKSDKNAIMDGIGDALVVLINIAAREGVELTDCLFYAYNEIKDRKGRMVNGVFVKESK